jgi:multidrug efflux pump subunit AcrA (membrane-fusion protein)
VRSSEARVLAAAVRHAAMQRSLEGLARATCHGLADLVAGERHYCLFYDAGGRTLWREGDAHASTEIPSTTGLVGFAASTRSAIAVECASSDPRYAREADDPAGRGNERLAVHPIVDSRGEAQAVVVLVRSAGESAFAPRELHLISIFSRQLAPLFEAANFAALGSDFEDEPTVVDRSPFDPAAIAAFEESRDQGELLDLPRLLPGWAYALVTALVIACAIASVLVRVNRYATGPAIVIATDGVDVTSPVDGIVERVEVRPGDRVAAGAIVARLRADAEENDLARAEREFEQRLALRLEDPADEQLEAAVAEARLALDRARARVEERWLVASRDGTVGDVALEPGAAVSPGQTVVSLVPEAGELRLRAIVPAHHRPALTPGQPVRLEIDGYPFTYEHMTVTRVGERVLGPSETRAALGREFGDAVETRGPIVIVEASLDRPSFDVDGVRYRFHGGMTGEADVRVGDDPLAFVLAPVLKRLFE